MRQKIVVTDPLETEKIVEHVNKVGLKKAGKKYGISPGRLSVWIRNQDYEMVRQYRKKVVKS